MNRKIMFRSWNKKFKCCGENIKFEMTDLKSRAELLQEGWFIEDK